MFLISNIRYPLGYYQQCILYERRQKPRKNYLTFFPRVVRHSPFASPLLQHKLRPRYLPPHKK